MMNRLIIFSSVFNLLIAETEYPGLDAFTSSARLAMGGAGYLNYSSVSSKYNPSITGNGRHFSSSFIRYQTGITSQSAGISFPWKNGVSTMVVRHISYGTFDGYDADLQSTGTYRSGDSFLSVSHSIRMNRMPVNIGVLGQLFSSMLQDYTINTILFSLGGELLLETINGSIGLSIHNVGTTLNGSQDAKGVIVPKIVFSGSKQLSHLPLTLFIDLVTKSKFGETEVYFGGQFKLKSNLQLRLGTSTRKIDHNTEQDLSRSILGATGFGIGYAFGSTDIHYGTFIMGTGSLIHGLEIGVKIE